MSDDYARPGDTIEVTWNHVDWLGKKFVVVECPDRYMHTSVDHPSHAWFSEANEGCSYFAADCYKIVSRANGRAVSGSDVDKSLDRQRDDNLRGVFT